MTEARDMPTSDKQDALDKAAREFIAAYDAPLPREPGARQDVYDRHNAAINVLRTAVAALDASPRPEVQEDEWVASPEWGPHEPGLPQDYGYEPDETPNAKSEPREVQEEAATEYTGLMSVASVRAMVGAAQARIERAEDALETIHIQANGVGYEVAHAYFASQPREPVQKMHKLEVQEEAEAREVGAVQDAWNAYAAVIADAVDAATHRALGYSRDEWIARLDAAQVAVDLAIRADERAVAVRGEAEARIAAWDKTTRDLVHGAPAHRFDKGVQAVWCDLCALLAGTPDAPLTCTAIVGSAAERAVGALSYCGLPLPCPDHDAPQEAE